MGVFTSQNEYVSAISAARLFKALSTDSANVFPRALPNFIKGVEIIEGDGGAGTIKKVTLAEGYVKDRVDVIDTQNYVYHYSVIEGGALSDKLEKVTTEYKFVEAPNGGTIIKAIHKYYTKDNEQLTEEYLQERKQQTAGFIKAVEDYIVANPDYN